MDSGKAHEWIVQGEQRREYTARLRVPLVTSVSDLWNALPRQADPGIILARARVIWCNTE